MPRGVYDRTKKNKPTTTEKVKKVYRTKTAKASSLVPVETPVSAHTMGGFQNLIAYYHALVVSKTQGVKSEVLETEIVDTVAQLKALRIELFGATPAEKAVETPAVKIPVQEVSPEVPQQAVFTPPA